MNSTLRTPDFACEVQVHYSKSNTELDLIESLVRSNGVTYFQRPTQYEPYARVHVSTDDALQKVVALPQTFGLTHLRVVVPDSVVERVQQPEVRLALKVQNMVSRDGQRVNLSDVILCAVMDMHDHLFALYNTKQYANRLARKFQDRNHLNVYNKSAYDIAKELTLARYAGGLLARISDDAHKHTAMAQHVYDDWFSLRRGKVCHAAGKHLLIVYPPELLSLFNIILVFGLFTYRIKDEKMFIEFDSEDSAFAARQCLPQILYRTGECRDQTRVTFFRRKSELPLYRVHLTTTNKRATANDVQVMCETRFQVRVDMVTQKHQSPFFKVQVYSPEDASRLTNSKQDLARLGFKIAHQPQNASDAVAGAKGTASASAVVNESFSTQCGSNSSGNDTHASCTTRRNADGRPLPCEHDDSVLDGDDLNMLCQSDYDSACYLAE